MWCHLKHQVAGGPAVTEHGLVGYGGALELGAGQGPVVAAGLPYGQLPGQGVYRCTLYLMLGHLLLRELCRRLMAVSVRKGDATSL